jgi:hypothetical protein
VRRRSYKTDEVNVIRAELAVMLQDELAEEEGRDVGDHKQRWAEFGILGGWLARRPMECFRGQSQRMVPLEPAICLTVMGGWDTDCTGATAGALVGVLRGASSLPDKWVGAFNDRLESIVIGMTDSRFSDLAERTLAQSRRLAPATSHQGPVGIDG